MKKVIIHIPLFKRIYIRIVNYFLPFIYTINPLKPKLYASHSRERELIVSLTTYPARIEKVWVVIETILHQKVKPDRIILWLYIGEFQDKNLPKNLIKLTKRGLEIRYCDVNMKPHKKYYYTIFENPDADVITVDDDIFYPRDLVQNIIYYKNKYPGSIISPIVHEITIERGKIKPYTQWKKVRANTEPRKSNLFIGAGGVLYPAGCLSKDVFNLEVILGDAIIVDDLWLKLMSIKRGTKVASIAGEYPSGFIPLFHRNDNPLTRENLAGGNNDRMFNSLLNRLNINIESLQDP